MTPRAHYEAMAKEAAGDEPMKVAMGLFLEYFVKNYPGPETIIHNPLWHGPRIFRAAVWVIEHAYAGSGDQACVASFPRESTDESDRSDALCDLNYVRGLKAGFILGNAGDNDGLKKAIESSSGYLSALKEIRKAREVQS